MGGGPPNSERRDQLAHQLTGSGKTPQLLLALSVSLGGLVAGS